MAKVDRHKPESFRGGNLEKKKRVFFLFSLNLTFLLGRKRVFFTFSDKLCLGSNSWRTEGLETRSFSHILSAPHLILKSPSLSAIGNKYK